MEVGATFDFRCQCHVASILQAGVLVILLSVNTVFTTSSVRWQGPQLPVDYWLPAVPAPRWRLSAGGRWLLSSSRRTA